MGFAGRQQGERASARLRFFGGYFGRENECEGGAGAARSKWLSRHCITDEIRECTRRAAINTQKGRPGDGWLGCILDGGGGGIRSSWLGTRMEG